MAVRGPYFKVFGEENDDRDFGDYMLNIEY